MLKQPERGSRNVNDLFYKMEGRQIQKMNEVLASVELTKAEERTLIWLARWEDSTVDHLLSVIEKTCSLHRLHPLLLCTIQNGSCTLVLKVSSSVTVVKLINGLAL